MTETLPNGPLYYSQLDRERRLRRRGMTEHPGWTMEELRAGQRDRPDPSPSVPSIPSHPST